MTWECLWACAVTTRVQSRENGSAGCGEGGSRDAHAEASLRSAFKAERRLPGSGFWNASTPVLLAEPIASSRNARVWPRSELGAASKTSSPCAHAPEAEALNAWILRTNEQVKAGGRPESPCRQLNGRPAQGLSPASCPWGLFPICFLTKQKVEKPLNSYCHPKS